MFDELSLKIFAAQNECVLSWITQDGSPASTVVSFIYAEEAIWDDCTGRLCQSSGYQS